MIKTVLMYFHCYSVGALLTLEVQKGREPMRKKRWSSLFGGTAGCTMRLVDQSQYCGYKGGMADRKTAKDNGKRETYYGDSWFTSIKAILGILAEFGHEYFGALKTNHSGTPKEEIEKIMDKWNPGSYLVLECEEHGMFILGYKYSHRKKGEFAFMILHFNIAQMKISPDVMVIAVCVFLGSWNAGSTTLGKPYTAKYPDKHGNVQQRPVPRPEIVGKYFGVSNKIDTHNQLRQNELALEQHWLTQDAWFRLDTTFVGMTVTDAFLLARFSASSDAGFKRMSIKDYALHTAYDLFHRNTSAEPVSEIIISDTLPRHQQRETSNSPITWEQAMETHVFRPTTQRDSNGALTRRKCSVKEPSCENCYGTRECSHEACRAIRKPANNRHPDTFGVFVCEKTACRKKHWMTIANQSRIETDD